MVQNLHSEDDQRLADMLKQKDQRSLAIVYDKYAAALFGIICRINNNKNQAEEILQSTFVRAWEQVSGFNPSRTSFFTWLINIARQSAFEKNKALEEMNSKTTGLVNKVGKKEEQVFYLLYYKGLNHVEAATTLGITPAECRINLRTTIKDMIKNTITT